MKIAVCILTRENPVGLICAIQACQALSSGQNEVKFFVRYDIDDELTPRGLDLITGDIHVTAIVKKSPVALGEAWNDFVPLVLERGFDAICPLGDDVFPTVQGWDLGVETMLVERQFEVFAWRELNNPTNVTYPIISRRYLEACGKLFCEHFPFWFSDTWLAQVYEFAKGSPVAIATDMTLGGRRPETKGMRDVAFWVDFWVQTRNMRISEGNVIRQAMGWPDVDVEPSIEKFKRLDEKWNPEAIEAAHMAPGEAPPSSRYLEAKARAMSVLAEVSHAA